MSKCALYDHEETMHFNSRLEATVYKVWVTEKMVVGEASVYVPGMVMCLAKAFSNSDIWISTVTIEILNNVTNTSCYQYDMNITHHSSIFQPSLKQDSFKSQHPPLSNNKSFPLQSPSSYPTYLSP